MNSKIIKLNYVFQTKKNVSEKKKTKKKTKKKIQATQITPPFKPMKKHTHAAQSDQKKERTAVEIQIHI